MAHNKQTTTLEEEKHHFLCKRDWKNKQSRFGVDFVPVDHFTLFLSHPSFVWPFAVGSITSFWTLPALVAFVVYSIFLAPVPQANHLAVSKLGSHL